MISKENKEDELEDEKILPNPTFKISFSIAKKFGIPILLHDIKRFY